jgi:hypothetical protein
MGFNKRKMEDDRRHAAEQEAATRRATDRQILEDAEQRTPGQADADAVLADDRRRYHGRLLVPTRALPGLPHHRRRRPADARLAPRRGRDGPYLRAVLPLLPAACAVCGIGVPVKVERGRGVLCGAQRQ